MSGLKNGRSAFGRTAYFVQFIAHAPDEFSLDGNILLYAEYLLQIPERPAMRFVIERFAYQAL